MKQGLSLHIGLNVIDPTHYGDNGQLYGCINDAKDMVKLAKKRGFTPTLLTDDKATAKTVISQIKAAAKTLKTGDFFLVTYSGHGSQVPDMNGDKDDRMDETWCLYDRMLVDDELAQLWAGFKTGVRILVLSDSCHSGTVVRAFPAPASPRLPRGQKARLLPTAIAKATYKRNQTSYDLIQAGTKGAGKSVIKASVILISGCQDTQVSIDDGTNGVFTRNLKAVLSRSFPLGYKRLRDLIAARMDRSQSPNYYPVGTSDPAFARQEVFSISPDATAAPTRPPRARTTTTREPTARDAEETTEAFVLRQLRGTGYHQPRLDSDISTWFREIERVDDALALPLTRTDAFLLRYLNRFPGVVLGKSELISGVYPTPQHLVNLANS